MSNTLEAKLKLDIAELIANQAKAQMETRKWIDDLRNEGKRGAKAVDDIAAATKRANDFIKQTASLNPWAPMTTGAIRYASAVQKAAEAQRSVQANPWATAGASAYAAQQATQQATQQRLAARAAAMQQMDAAAVAGGTGIISGNAALRAQAERSRMMQQMQMSRGGRAGGGLQMAGLGMQAQDIAVQLQMGTKASIVLAQQGSQILSYFGTGGAVLGGVLAIGGAFYTMAEKSKEAFAAMKADADSFGTRLKASLAGSSTEIAAFFAEVQGGVKSAYAEIEGLNSGAGGLMARITQLFGGPSVEDRQNTANALAVQKANALATIQQALLDMSAKELRIAELKAAGQDQAAASMQRQLQLQREMQRIQGMDLPDEVKARLAQDATAKAKAEGLASVAPDPEEAKRVAEQLRQLKQEAAGIAESMLPDAQRLIAMKSRLQDLMEAARIRNPGVSINGVGDMGSLAAASKHAAPVEEYKKALEIQREISALEKSMADAAKSKRQREVEEIRALLEKTKHQQEQDQKQQEQQTRSKNELAAEMRIDALRAQGKKEMAEIEQRRLDIAREAFQIQQQTGLSEQQSLMLARQRDAMRAAMGGGDAAARDTKARVFTEADRQAGWTHPSIRAGKARLMGSAGGSGLDQHFSNQRNASQWEMAQRQPSQWQQLQNRAAGFDQRQSANAPDSKSSGTPTINLGAKEIETLMAIKDGILALMG